ncbi:hypothetical protein H4Q26_004854 [Puccinia striiformis f. sp. tritici PST-130]|nr:hypothetical protein H4Q26_004854 [Puccinia striiformis f. sp. tritici PST-130]
MDFVIGCDPSTNNMIGLRAAGETFPLIEPEDSAFRPIAGARCPLDLAEWLDNTDSVVKHTQRCHASGDEIESACASSCLVHTLYTTVTINLTLFDPVNDTMLHRPCYLTYPYGPNSQRAPKQVPALSPHRTFARNFFNRSPEIGELTSRLKANPRFTVMLGPPSSGKTTLAQLVTSQMRNDNTGKRTGATASRSQLLGDTVLIIDEANAFKEADDKSYQRGVKNACHFHLIRLLLRSKFPHYATDICWKCRLHSLSPTFEILQRSATSPLESVITAQSEPALRAMEAPLKKCGKQ